MDYDRDYFKGKTVIVTGAASGIGLALVEELLECGAEKAVMADINKDRLDEEAGKLQSRCGDRVKAVLCDVTAEAQVQSLVAESAEFFGGRVDLLINNAGAAFTGRFEDLSNADWKAAFDLNFYSALYGMRAVIPIMQAQGGGQIVNVISGIAFSPMAFQSRYTATKAALNGLTLTLRYEYWDDNIKISSATPGTTATHIFDGVETPPYAQTPRQSASRILHGVVAGDRVIFGSDQDRDGALDSCDYRKQAGNDAYFLRVARERRAGKTAF